MSITAHIVQMDFMIPQISILFFLSPFSFGRLPCIDGRVYYGQAIKNLASCPHLAYPGSLLFSGLVAHDLSVVMLILVRQMIGSW
jgi:hypothetical protein